ncbi:TetR/AcrR family transcriptional regulator [Bacillus horti]|uniref:AcrR family transcriptional regulator n=1 Tax=Caldalkalibacillus horti TaxID=77523 RepID=A0ABT9VV62_9BACI|nr:TetR/AcrR family transcriptional regulator [Bacillus horti]MDQ0164868.1 AcrR family transcriptional regulator [Bacillus horti]
MTDKDKRDLIIKAAYQVLAEKGYDKASTKEIAQTAGVAQGLINYYFPSKDLLFAEVFQQETKKYCESLQDLKNYGSQELSVENLKQVLQVPKNRALSDSSMVLLRYELFAIGLRNEKVSENLKETLQTKRARLNDLIQTIGHLPEDSSKPLASILLSVFDGLALQQMCDDEFNYDEAYDMLAVVLESYLTAANKKEEK